MERLVFSRLDKVNTNCIANASKRCELLLHMKVYVTKYALTEGIKEMEVEECEASPRMVRSVNPDRIFGIYFHGEGREWHKTVESAVAKAELMRLKKIQVLKKSLLKLEEMKFGIEKG